MPKDRKQTVRPIKTVEDIPEGPQIFENMDIPIEILDFIKRGGRTLLVKGRPGAGKTVFGLMLLRIFRQAGRRAFYVSTRVDAARLYSDFPWLSQVLKEDGIVDATISNYSTWFGVEGEYIKVKKLAYEGCPKFLSDLKDLVGKSGLVVLDSYEAVIAHFDLWDKRRDILAGICDFARKTGVNLVLVSEGSSPEEAEYFADGVVELSTDFVDGRMIRKATILKLRGTPIRKHMYCYTLNEASFRVSYLAPGSSKIRPKWEPIPNPEGYYSTGIRDLDEILGGGYRRGSVVLFEFSGDLPIFTRSAFLLTLLNFSSQGGHISLIPPLDTSPRRLMRIITKYMDNDTFLKNFTVFGREEALDPWVKKLKARSADELTEKMKEIEGQTIAKRVPILRFIGLGNLEYGWGRESVMGLLHRYVPEVKSKYDLMILAGFSHLKSIEACADIANAHFKLTSENGCQIMYGIKPRTIPYGIESKESTFRLIPLL